MARFDVYPMAGTGYVLDVQATLLAHLNTRVVVPLIPAAKAPPPIKELNPIFTIHGEPHVMLTQALASIPCSELKKPSLSLDAEHDVIAKALDLLLIGY
jgi:toxin CcdB